MTELQKMVLENLDMLGPATDHELAVACLIEPKQRGGFQTGLLRMMDRGLIAADEWQIDITPAGLAALRAQ